MPQEVSRRGFLAGLGAGGGLLATAAERATADAVIQPVHPLFEPPASTGPVRILLAARLTPAEAEAIRMAAPSVDLIVPAGPAELRAAAAEAEVILGEPDVETIRVATRLKWVQHWAAGVERLPRERCWPWTPSPCPGPSGWPSCASRPGSRRWSPRWTCS